MDWKKFGSRKFLALLVLIGASAGGLFTGHLDGTAWAATCTALLAVYHFSNVWQKGQSGGTP